MSGIKLSSGFVAGTPVTASEDGQNLRTIDQLNKIIIPEDAFAFDNEMNIQITSIGMVHQSYSPNIWCVLISNGLFLEGVESSLLFDSNLRWRTFRSLAPGDKIVGVQMDEAGMHGEFFEIVKSYQSPLTAQQAIYYFQTEHHNLLIPYFDKENVKLTFVCTHQ